jgi:hypothetical protein
MKRRNPRRANTAKSLLTSSSGPGFRGNLFFAQRRLSENSGKYLHMYVDDALRRAHLNYPVKLSEFSQQVNPLCNEADKKYHIFGS